MKITAGLGSIDEYERFVQVGADEFFCGYVPFSWAERYGTVMQRQMCIRDSSNAVKSQGGFLL